MATISHEDQRVIDSFGDGIPHPSTSLYEKTTDDIELVAGLIAKRGTAQHQAKICGAADTPIGIFDKQTEHQPLVSSKPNTNYAQDTYPVRVIGQCKLAWVVLTTSQTIVAGNKIEVIAGGKTQLFSAGTVIGRAAQDKTTTTDEAWLLVWNLINKS